MTLTRVITISPNAPAPILPAAPFEVELTTPPVLVAIVPVFPVVPSSCVDFVAVASKLLCFLVPC